MAASKLTPRRLLLESHRSGKLRKAVCGSHGLAISLLLACSAGAFLLCFMFVDVKTLYDHVGTVKAHDFVLQRETFGTTFLSRHDSDAVTESRATPRTEVAMDHTSNPATEDATQSAASIPNELIRDPQSEVRDRRSLVGCDIYHGLWVYDESYPLYRSRNCPFVDPGFRCEDNGRPDQNFMKYRWQPHDCDLPRFHPGVVLERLRDQRVVFVGDSLGRNQWESMLCMLAEAVQNKSRIYEVNGQSIGKTIGELVYKFQDYNCTVEYYRDPFLVPQLRPPPAVPSNVTTVLRPDLVSCSVGKWPGANIMVFNSGHWWSWEKIGRPGGRFYVNDTLTNHSYEEAFKLGLETWALWMEQNLNPVTSQVFFRSFAPVHFRGGAWNKGGHCHDETHPLTDEEVEKEQGIPWTNKYIVAAINDNIKEKRGAVEFMDVTTATNYRADGHAGLYGRDVKIHGLPPKNRQDCSHFCLPGVPDTWNELLYAALLARGQGAWAEPISRY